MVDSAAHPQIYLASQSPRRRELLRQIGVRFERISGDIDETPQPAESAKDYVRRLALEKARAGWSGVQRKLDLPVLGADTVVVADDVILGKPQDENDCLRMLSLLEGRSHKVMTAVALVSGSKERVLVQTSTVWFGQMSPQTMRAYWLSGEPADKAGAYGVQGLAAMFIERIDGSYTGVMGLPLYETAQLLTEFAVGGVATLAERIQMTTTGLLEHE